MSLNMKRAVFPLCLFSLSGVSRASLCGRSDEGICGSPLSDDASGLLQVPARAQLLQPTGHLDKPDSLGAGQNLKSGLDLSPPCSMSGNKCTEVYGSEFRENGAGLSTWDNHGDQVYCAKDNHDEAIKWSQDGTALTIAYLGKAGRKSSTCYVTTPSLCGMGLCDADLGYRSLASRGYMSVDIAVNKVSGDLDAKKIWPAFWILNWRVADWPKGGELDIAERQGGSTEEHIIVTNTPKWVTELQSMWPSAAMSPDGETHNYGFEWHFVNEQGGLNQLDFTIYWDGQKTGQTYSCFASDTSNLGCQYMFRGMADGRMITIFDADSQFYSGCGSASATDNACQQYSMTVSNFKVYRVQ